MIPARTAPRGPLRARFLLCVLVVAAVFGMLGMRLFYLQVVHGSRYRYLSENNRIRLERIPAPRGMVLDRRGEILADVRASFDALVVPAEFSEARREGVYAELSQVLDLPPEEVIRVVEGPGPARWKPRLVKRRLEWAEMARIEAHRLELPGVLVQANPVRHYPFRGLLGGSLGYVGEISPRELGSAAYAEYAPGDELGRAGLERAWEGTLRGNAGGQQVEVDVRGRKLGVLAKQSAQPGRNLVLAVDRRLQQTVEAVMRGKAGGVVVLHIETGDVLAMVSSPTFDPNILARGVTVEEWDRLASDPTHPLQHRATQGQYPPGSTFKIVTALAGLAKGVITRATEVLCIGEYQFAGRVHRCWKKGGHGWVDLERALVESCDVYFYELGMSVGVDSLHRWAGEFGLGRRTGIDLPGESSGLVPSKEWKRRVRKEPWYTGETVSVSIGQGYLLTTPLQLASMVAALAHPHGARMRPRIVTRIEDAQGRALEEIPVEELGRLSFQRIHLEEIRKALRGVVAGERGTARKAEVKGFAVAGKTGTAQVVKLPSDENLDEETIPWERRDHALFVCYAPFDEAEIAVAVVVEHGGHGGSAAAPIAAEVIRRYRDLKADGVGFRAAEPAPVAASKGG